MSKKICPFWERGICKFGDKCKNSHKYNIFLFGHGGRIMINYCIINKNTVKLTLFNTTKGDKYDNYPVIWNSKNNPFTLVDIVPDLILPKITSGIEPDVILCGSRGGQIILPTLWQYGYNYPAVVINGDIVNYYKKTKQKFPDNLKLVLLVGGKDYFKNYDTIISQAPWQPGIFIVRDPVMSHMPNYNRLNKMLPAMIQTARTGNGISLFQLKRNNPKEFSNLEIFNRF